MSKEKSDLTVKIFALIIAIILWSYVMSEENPTITREYRNIPVTITNINKLEAKNLVVVEPEEPTVNIKISGKRNTINRISEKDILAKVDLSGYDEGISKIPVDVDVPSDVSIVDIDNREIPFKIEKIIKKETQIDIETSGELPDGYVLGEGNHTPHSIYLEGPRSWIDSVSKVVATVELTDRTEDISVNAPLTILDKEGNVIRGINKEKNSVDIFIPIYQKKRVAIDLKVAGLSSGEVASKYKVSPREIEIKGKKELLKDIDSIATKTIDKDNLQIGTSLDLIVPEGVTVISKEKPKIVSADAPEKEEIKSSSKQLKYKLKDINLTGIKDNIKISEEDLNRTIEVLLEGDQAILNKVNSVKLRSNLSGINIGKHTIDIEVDGIDGVSIKLNPNKMSVTFEEK